jgi:hypothetical protein
MKTALTAATVATLTLAPNLTAQAGNPTETEAPHEMWQREPRHQYEDRLREAQHKRANRMHRETRHEREERLREAGRNRSPWAGPDSV